MHSQHTNDTSAQAMTEVALGLSMAFFALLIVALLSFQMPEQQVESVSKELAQQNSQEQEKVHVQTDNQQAKAVPSDTQFIFFYQGRFIDQNLKPVELTSLQTSTPVVLAVEQSLSFAEVMKIRQNIKHPNLSITLMSAKWKNALEQH